MKAQVSIFCSVLGIVQAVPDNCVSQRHQVHSQLVRSAEIEMSVLSTTIASTELASLSDRDDTYFGERKERVRVGHAPPVHRVQLHKGKLPTCAALSKERLACRIQLVVR